MEAKSCLLIVFFFLLQDLNAQDSTQSIDVSSWQNYVQTIDMDQNELAQDENPTPSSLLLAGRNYFLNVYSFSFFNVRYRQRGYENFSGRSYINSVPINSLETNNVQYGLFSGLSNVFRVTETAEQLAAADYSFGGLGNHFSLNTSPTNQRNKLRLNYSFSNRNYQHRLAGIYNSGIHKNGWNYLLAFNMRYSAQGYYPGTYYNGLGYLVSAEKKFKRNVLSIAVFGSDYETGRQTAAVKETFGLSNTNFYNPQWGFQNGRRRNANVFHSFLPTATINYKAVFSDKLYWNTSVGVTIGKVSSTGLEWYNAPDPRPDYYRYLPSFFKNDAAQYDALTQTIRNSPNLLQINWDKMHQVNTAQSNGRALYALGSRTTKSSQINAASTVCEIFSPIWKLNVGVEFQLSKQRNYKEMRDLLGAQYWLNVNAFIERDNPADITTIQNDMDHPDAKIIAGDKYSYDYSLTTRRFSEWVQLNFNTKKWDAFIATELNVRQLSRTGNVRNGLFPNSSFGKDPTLTTLAWNGKMGATYKIDGRKYLFLNVASLQQPEMPNIVYISPTTRNVRNDRARTMTIETAELGFAMNAPTLKIRGNVYYTLSQHAGEFRYFYDDVHQNFASYILNDIEKKYYGAELALDWKFYRNWSYSLVSNLSKSLYANRPQLIVTSETSAEELSNERVYLKNFNVPNTPQTIVHNGLGYRNGTYFFTLDANAFFNRWTAINPMRRTVSILEDVNPVSQKELRDNILKQEKLPNGWTLDCFAGYSFFIKKSGKNRYYIDLLLSGNNLLSKKIIAYAYEQMRIDLKGYDLDKFSNKYSYAMGRNCSVNIVFRF